MVAATVNWEPFPKLRRSLAVRIKETFPFHILGLKPSVYLVKALWLQPIRSNKVKCQPIALLHN
jgi:hypothetical protein